MRPTNELIDHLVESIRRICREKQVSISQMESDLGFSAGLISRWSKTKTSPAFDKIVAVMEYLDVTYDELMSGNARDESMNHSSSQQAATKEDVAKKLLSDSESGRIEWFDMSEGEPFHISFEQIFPDWGRYHDHRIYYTSFRSGYFFIALQCNYNTLEMSADIYMLVEDGFEPRLMKDTNAYAKKLIKYADSLFYTEWERKTAEKMEAEYLEF